MKVQRGQPPPRVVVGERLKASTINALIDLHGGQLQQQPTPTYRGREFPYSDRICFGWTWTAEATGTLWDGIILYGTNAVVQVGANTGITITADGQYVGIEYDTTDGTVSLYGPNVTYPVSSGAVYRAAMYKFGYDSGSGVAEIANPLGILEGGRPIHIAARFGDAN